MIDPQLSDYLDYYLDDAPPGERAVLINGPWGSGKTHFIQAYMAERDQRRKVLEPLSRSHLYVSLYGVRSTAEIEDRVFAAAHPALSSWPVALMASAAKRAGNTFLGGKLLADEDGATVRRALMQLDDAALVFDDLERAGMPVNDVLGFINGFVEHRKVKTILLASETDIPDAATFQARKEKLIGFTLRISSTPDGVLKSFAAALANPEVRNAVDETIPKLTASFTAAGGGNYRIAKDILQAIDRLITRVDPRLKGSYEAMADLLPLLIAAGLELRTGGLTLAELTDLNTSGNRRIVEAKRRHPGANWAMPVIPIEAWGALLMEGRLDVESINARIGIHHLVVGDASTPTWRRLWDWRNIESPDEFEEVCDQVRDELSSLSMREPAVILQIAGTALDLSQSGYRLFRDADPIQYLTGYAADIQAKGFLSPDIEIFEDINSSSYQGLGYFARGDADFERFRDEMQALVQKALDLKALRASATLLSALQAGRWDRLVNSGLDEGGFGETPVLHHLPLSSFADLILIGARVNQSLLSALALRYRTHVRDGSPFEAERVWLGVLQSTAIERAGNLPPPFRDWALESLQDRFGKIMTNFGVLKSDA